MWNHIWTLLRDFYEPFLYGVISTLILAIVGTVVGLFIGIVVALIGNIKVKPKDNWFIKFLKRLLHVITRIYVTVFRGTPMMVQAMIIFFGITAMGFTWPDFGDTKILSGAFICGLIVITINTGAYMSEIVKSGLNGIDKGQDEACRSLGMTYWQSMLLVTIPQALRNSLPTILNEYIVNVKDSSVLNVIGLTELYASVSIATSTNYFKVEGYIIIAVIYLVLTLLATLLVNYINKKLEGGKTNKRSIFTHAKIMTKGDK